MGKEVAYLGALKIALNLRGAIKIAAATNQILAAPSVGRSSKVRSQEKALLKGIFGGGFRKDLRLFWP